SRPPRLSQRCNASRPGDRGDAELPLRTRERLDATPVRGAVLNIGARAAAEIARINAGPRMQAQFRDTDAVAILGAVLSQGARGLLHSLRAVLGKHSTFKGWVACASATARCPTDDSGDHHGNKKSRHGHAEKQLITDRSKCLLSQPICLPVTKPIG